MPIPQPNISENNADFMQRCMTDSTMVVEYADQSQRYAVCAAQLPTNSKAAREWRKMDRQRSKFRRIFRKEFKKALDEQIKPILEQIGEGKANGLSYEALNERTIKDKMIKLYRETGSAFAKKQFNEVKGISNDYQIKADANDLEDIWKIYFADYVENQLGTKIISITADSKKIVQKKLKEILSEMPNAGSQEQAQKLRKMVTDEYLKSKAYRVERIVRTETTAASNLGLIKGMDSTGMKYKKVWQTAIDERTRTGHSIANGQTVNKDEPFLVDGENLMYPGDPNGMPGNVINCRCTHSFELIR